MVEVVIRTPFDYLAQGILDGLLPEMGTVDTELEVLAEAQSVDVAFEPDPARVEAGRRRGTIGRMAGQGPCMFEPFSSTPPLDAVRACVRKQYTLDHMRVRASAPVAAARPPFPRLWVLSPGEPRQVLTQYGLQPMSDWPAGFWEGPPAAPLHVVVLRSLPHVRDTLLLRLMGRGVTLREAVQDLHALPDDAWERQVSLPLLVAFDIEKPQDWVEAEEMNSLRELKATYAEWEKRVKDEGRSEGRSEGLLEGLLEGRRQMLRAQLGERFGPLPADVIARIEDADSEQLDRWIRRVLSAQSLEDVLAS